MPSALFAMFRVFTMLNCLLGIFGLPVLVKYHPISQSVTPVTVC